MPCNWLLMIFVYDSNCHIYAMYLQLDSPFLPLNSLPWTLKLPYNHVSCPFWESLCYGIAKKQIPTNA